MAGKPLELRISQQFCIIPDHFRGKLHTSFQNPQLPRLSKEVSG
jgi:hypothetical protein